MWEMQLQRKCHLCVECCDPHWLNWMSWTHGHWYNECVSPSVYVYVIWFVFLSPRTSTEDGEREREKEDRLTCCWWTFSLSGTSPKFFIPLFLPSFLLLVQLFSSSFVRPIVCYPRLDSSVVKEGVSTHLTVLFSVYFNTCIFVVTVPYSTLLTPSIVAVVSWYSHRFLLTLDFMFASLSSIALVHLQNFYAL